jgi:peptidylprolyl isomerase
MVQADKGNRVKVHYTGKLDDGRIFDTSIEGEPLEFELGKGELIVGFEEAVIGMAPGDKKTATIQADNAYGPYRQDLLLKVDKGELPNNIEARAGVHLQMIKSDGKRLPILISDVSGNEVTLDANHPLAGKDLVFDIELLEIL